ncbi:CD151 antigen-like isoform X2 [Varroa jacobsoni]|uniref:Tetraspanin n=1 Tax=Varroa destructor TaxID=109461 RepID=A0A7M7M4F8_VARDE|nr:CD151 antigen-like isoform X1 [Varroa destructor]XP_022689761.1 CD151 antigen-like isoform X2 [Varroa jacobsoni]
MQCLCPMAKKRLSTSIWLLGTVSPPMIKISGLLLVFLGVSELRSLEHSTRVHIIAAYILLAAAGLIVFVSLLGYVSICRLHRDMLAWYGGFLVMILLLETACGILCFFSYGYVRAELQAQFHSLFLEKYEKDDLATRTVDRIQRDLKCCGMVGFEDWENSEWRREKSISYINLVPPSCCKTWTALCGRWDIPNNIHYDGCIDVIARRIERNLSFIAGVGTGIYVIQMLGVVMVYMLHSKLKNFEVANHSVYNPTRHNQHLYDHG